MGTKKQQLYGWGHAPVAQCEAWRPEKQRDLRLILRQHNTPTVARGLGRAYGDAALQPSGVICTSRLNHFIAFDTVHGIVTAQAGASLSDLMDIAIPKGWIPPVIPGTRHVTLGGCFACNVHGKNQFREGDFAEHVLSIKLTLATSETVECSRDVYADLFWATAGGMGMTGVIEEVTLKLKPIASASLATLTYRVDDIEDLVSAFEHYRNSADYMVGWIDHMGKDADTGRGVFEAANHILPNDGGVPLTGYTPARSRIAVPLFAPAFLLNKHVMARYNAWRFKKYSSERTVEKVGFNGFFHPLDSIGGWNKLYGKRGFFQYQCLIPEALNAAAALRDLLELIHQYKLFSFLAVLKYHRDGIGLLTFSKRGYSLALDFPNTPEVRSFLPVLDRRVAEHGGRVYLAKDALLTAETFYAMYGENANHWRDILHDIDPHARFTSLMSDRLQWKTPA